MLLFIDDAMRHADEYILKYKSETLAKFIESKALREQESDKQVKQRRADEGGEYTSKKFAEYLKSDGIFKEKTTPYSPQSDGVVERANRTIMVCVRCMLDDAALSKKYLAFAVSERVYVTNGTPTGSVVVKTPCEPWYRSGRKPSLKHLPVFGCSVFLHDSDRKRKKVDWRATPGILLGTAYRLSSTSYTIHGPGRFTSSGMLYSGYRCGTQHRILLTMRS
jgi:hypothetical protein